MQLQNSPGNAVLSWDDFHDERTARIKNMLANQTFTDVTLLCNDPGTQDQVAITAHRVILAAASEFFNRVLQRDQDRGAVLYLRGASKENVIGMLNFIYSGECSIASLLWRRPRHLRLLSGVSPIALFSRRAP